MHGEARKDQGSMKKLYVQYGCGLSAPEQWENFDTSPTLRIQKIPVLGALLKGRLNTVFPSNARYGDIVKGLPVEDDSCDGVYCSHVLEHLSLNDFRAALGNTYRILKPGGLFRCVVPDLEVIARRYLAALETKKETASIEFLRDDSLLGVVSRPRGLKGMLTSQLGNSHHLWMWDYHSLENELRTAGFKEIRKAAFNDGKDEMFRWVEEEARFTDAVALECSK